MTKQDVINNWETLRNYTAEKASVLLGDIYNQGLTRGHKIGWSRALFVSKQTQKIAALLSGDDATKIKNSLLNEDTDVHGIDYVEKRDFVKFLYSLEGELKRLNKSAREGETKNAIEVIEAFIYNKFGEISTDRRLAFLKTED